MLETQAQGHPKWVPYSGQLRLQAFSHLASGANMVEYWHYHSIHNSFETYWKGLLSHDFLPNPVYNEASSIGHDFKRLSDKLIDLKKNNKTAILVSNEALTAYNWFKMYTNMDYNDYVRRMYDTLYKLNIECDVIDSTFENFDKYSMIIVPPLYSVNDTVLINLNNYIKNGGNVIFGLRSGFCDENSTVRNVIQPGIINSSCGVNYNLFTECGSAKLSNGEELTGWIELLNLENAESLLTYEHPEWSKYSAVSYNEYGNGSSTYIGCFPNVKTMEDIFCTVFKKRGLIEVENSDYKFPIIIRKGINNYNNKIIYIFNYSSENVLFKNCYGECYELINNTNISENEEVEITKWGFLILQV